MKQLIVILSLVFSTSLFACGGSDKSADSKPPTTSSDSSDVSG